MIRLDRQPTSNRLHHDFDSRNVIPHVRRWIDDGRIISDHHLNKYQVQYKYIIPQFPIKPPWSNHRSHNQWVQQKKKKPNQNKTAL